MRFSFLLLFIFTGCATPLRFRAVIDTWYKDQYMRCEEEITQPGNTAKNICKISDDFDIKTQAKNISDNLAEVKFMIIKNHNLIASPKIILDREKPIIITTEKGNKKIIIKAERLP